MTELHEMRTVLFGLREQIISLDARLSVMEREAEAPVPPIEMPDEEFIAECAKLDPEWWPEWIQNGTGQRYRVSKIAGNLFVQSLGEFDKWYSHAQDTHVIAALLETNITKILREREVPRDVGRWPRNRKFTYARLVDECWQYGSVSGKWVDRLSNDIVFFDTFHEALLAAVKATK